MNAKKRLVVAYGQEFSEQQILGNDYHQSLADSGQFTEQQVADAWEKAKHIANENADQNPDIVPSYAYTTSIMQNLLGIKQTAMQVRAASRLVQANADEQQARDFIESVADIKVGKLEHSSPGVIRFTVMDASDFVKARKALTERYGKMDTSRVPYGSNGGGWKIAEKHHLMLSDTRDRGGVQANPYSISLVDDNHKERPAELIRRIIGPPKAITQK